MQMLRVGMSGSASAHLRPPIFPSWGRLIVIEARFLGAGIPKNAVTIYNLSVPVYEYHEIRV